MPAAQSSARQTASPGKVGYRCPPRHTQFRKGQSGNPGGRPRRRDEIERLKALTLAEVYRTVVVEVDGVAVEMPAMQAVLRRQVEAALKGSEPAQRALMKSVNAYERADAERAAIAAYAEMLAQEGLDLEEHVLRAGDIAIESTYETEMHYIDAARRVAALGLWTKKPEDDGDAGASGTEAAAEELAKKPAKKTKTPAAKATVTAAARETVRTRVPGKASGAAASGAATATLQDAERSAPAVRAEPPAGLRSPGAPPERYAHDLNQGPAPAAGANGRPDTVEETPPEEETDVAGGRHWRSAGTGCGGRRYSYAGMRKAGKNMQIPDNFPVLRASGPWSKRAARRERGRGR